MEEKENKLKKIVAKLKLGLPLTRQEEVYYKLYGVGIDEFRAITKITR